VLFRSGGTALAPHVCGIVNFHGMVAPVLSMRACSGLESLAPRINDMFVLITLEQRSVVLLVDSIEGLSGDELDEAMAEPGLRLTESPVDGVLKTEDGLIVLYDPEKFLTPDEFRRLDVAIAEHVS